MIPEQSRHHEQLEENVAEMLDLLMSPEEDANLEEWLREAEPGRKTEKQKMVEKVRPLIQLFFNRYEKGVKEAEETNQPLSYQERTQLANDTVKEVLNQVFPSLTVYNSRQEFQYHEVPRFRLMERLAFILSKIPEIAYSEYRASILKSVYDKNKSSNPDANRNLGPERKDLIKDLSFWSNQLAAFLADFGDEPEIIELTSRLWQNLDQEVAFVNKNFEQIPGFRSKSLGNQPITPEWIEKAQIDSANFPSGVTAQATILQIFQHAGFKVRPATPELDVDNSVDGIAYPKNQEPEEGLFLYQVKSDRKGNIGAPEVTNLAKNRPAGISADEQKAVENLLDSAKIIREGYGIDTKTFWIRIGRADPAQVDRRTGSLLGSVKQNRLFQTAAENIRRNLE